MGNREELLRIRRALAGFDADRYYEDGTVPEDVPDEVAEFAERLADSFHRHYAAALLKKQMQYVALQNQINPHFLYNTLEAIRSEALLQGSREIAEMVERLSRFFRYCISSQGDFVTIREELMNVKDYFYIQQYRFENKFSLVIETESDDLLRCYLPKMTFQPIVENAIFHGLEPKKGKGVIHIRAVRSDRKVYLLISDNGIGMEQEKADALNERLRHDGGGTGQEKNSKHGIALMNVNARIRLYFGSEYGLWVMSTCGKGTDVEIILPYLDDPAYIKLREQNGGEEK